MDVISSHPITFKWHLWGHLPNKDEWGDSSYIKIMTIHSIEDMLLLTELLPESIIQKCMLFIMKDGIKPYWEDPKNCNGGGFSYKVLPKNIVGFWNHLIYLLVGNTILNDTKLLNNLCGITVSPKKGGHNIVKIWMTNKEYMNPKIITSDKIMDSYKCVFLPHRINK